MELCNICGSAEFVPGPEGRASRSGLPPTCARCGSRERHRRGRALTVMLIGQAEFPTGYHFSWGDQTSAPKGLFKTVQPVKRASEGEVMLATLGDGSASFISCLNVMQAVQSPRQVISDIARVLAPEGLSIIAFPGPLTRTRSAEFGGAIEADAPRRVLGRDFEAVYGEVAPELMVFRTVAPDPVTQEIDIVYVATKNPVWLQEIFKLRLDVTLLD